MRFGKAVCVLINSANKYIHFIIILLQGTKGTHAQNSVLYKSLAKTNTAFKTMLSLSRRKPIRVDVSKTTSVVNRKYYDEQKTRLITLSAGL